MKNTLILQLIYVLISHQKIHDNINTKIKQSHLSQPNILTMFYTLFDNSIKTDSFIRFKQSEQYKRLLFILHTIHAKQAFRQYIKTIIQNKSNNKKPKSPRNKNKNNKKHKNKNKNINKNELIHEIKLQNNGLNNLLQVGIFCMVALD